MKYQDLLLKNTKNVNNGKLKVCALEVMQLNLNIKLNKNRELNNFKEFKSSKHFIMSNATYLTFKN